METRTAVLYALIRNAARRASDVPSRSVSRRTRFKKLSRSTTRRNATSRANAARFTATRTGSAARFGSRDDSRRRPVNVFSATATASVCRASRLDRMRIHLASVSFAFSETVGHSRRASFTHPGFESARRRNREALARVSSSSSPSPSSPVGVAARTTVPAASSDAHLSPMREDVAGVLKKNAARVASRNAAPSKHRAWTRAPTARARIAPRAFSASRKASVASKWSGGASIAVVASSASPVFVLAGGDRNATSSSSISKATPCGSHGRSRASFGSGMASTRLASSSNPSGSSRRRSSSRSFPPKCVSLRKICGTVTRLERAVMSSRRSGCADRQTSLYANPRDSSVAFARRQWPHDAEVKIVMRPIEPRGRTNRPRVVEVRRANDVNFSSAPRFRRRRRQKSGAGSVPTATLGHFVVSWRTAASQKRAGSRAPV